jgi:hypothetical protein
VQSDAALPQYCIADANNTFRMHVNIFASTVGEFSVDGCDGTSPVLLLRRGVSYTFEQVDVSNIGHPLAFAYAPDGPLVGAPPLAEPAPRACATPRLNCDPGVARQAPRYFIDGAAAGACSDNSSSSDGDDAAAMSAAARDAYVLSFQAPEAAWAAHAHAVRLTIPLASKTSTFFYHCALFPGMSGRIDVTPAAGATTTTGGGLNKLPAPFIPSAYYERLRSPPSGLNVVCGTRGLSGSSGMMGTMGGGGGGMMMAGGINNASCGADTPVGQFATCMRAIEHAMMAPMMPGMMGRGCQDPVSLFVAQMIPHHEGAVNMAKAALKLGRDSPGFDAMAPLLRNVVVTQNAQVLEMRAWQRQYD